MANYTFSDVSHVDNFDLTSFDSCMELSWTSLLESYPWEKAGLSDSTDDEKKESLRVRARSMITSSDSWLCRVYNNSADTCFYMGGNIDRDVGKIHISFLIYGADGDGSRRYIATDVLEMKKGFRVWARSQGCLSVSIIYVDSPTSMRTVIQNKYENHDYDLGTSTEGLNGDKSNNYRLSTSPDNDLLD